MWRNINGISEFYQLQPTTIYRVVSVAIGLVLIIVGLVLTRPRTSPREFHDNLLPEEGSDVRYELHTSTKVRVDKPKRLTRRLSDSIFHIPQSMADSIERHKIVNVKNLEVFTHLFYKFKSQRWLGWDKHSTHATSSLCFICPHWFPKLSLNLLQSSIPCLKNSNLANHHPLRDRKSPTYPNDTELYNYVTSRPHGETHAEELIMNKFPLLCQNYTKVNRKVTYLVLYSWLFACKECTEKIIKTTRKPQGITHIRFFETTCDVCLVYTIEFVKMIVLTCQR